VQDYDFMCRKGLMCKASLRSFSLRISALSRLGRRAMASDPSIFAFYSPIEDVGKPSTPKTGSKTTKIANKQHVNHLLSST
jgi:hypothetical protein